MKDVLVSVVMPAYNCEKYIGQAIRSVLEQTVSLELIIVEDKSGDGTEAVICEFLDDERVIYISNDVNSGVAASRNKGIDLARGKYIAFLDSDDYWTSDKLERQVTFMEKGNKVLSSTGRELIDENGVSTGRVIGIPDVICYKDLLKGNVLNTSGVMVLASVAKKYKMVQDHLHEDYIMWLSILKEYKVAYGINEPMLKYRVMKGTKSGNKLKSAKMTFGVYRYIGLNLPVAIYYFCHYAINGVRKYKG
ncbi:MAG: glycosyltransferase family 2 protein [Lachnospiraceae bacterium]|nr:glycosyltransferase family 2 protein [Lachnospiraceae bacterium]